MLIGFSDSEYEKTRRDAWPFLSTGRCRLMAAGFVGHHVALDDFGIGQALA